ncbi:exo-beta-N-acetylmuramidase NamZ family protein [Lederbergia citrea]|uniref:exo-beta-N-acetylmuramidase NamZ family protein n=1 Tax=Lederbergia citrea TaxID=2833581 RepID=UPI001BCA0A00|nr:DUF1343 domain-containing protein [Lederbergia citrea]MBS4176437.1 DUF1343 domain-containing protein [Lederbergia citrea]
MKKWMITLLTAVLVLSSLSAVLANHDNGNGKSNDGGKKNKKFAIGVEVLLKEKKNLIKGKKVGLITNPTGVDQELNSIVDLLHHAPDVTLTALYGPEHGVRGDAQAGQYVPYYIDEVTGLPVYSLYGSTRKPAPEMLENVDVLLFDIQDVGTRFYTYIYTMALAMEAAKEKGIPFIVLDRPNPLGGTKVEGPVLDPEFASFVGQYAIPLRHGMTVGELAKLFNREFGIHADLTVVEMKGWKRDSYYDETGLPFVLPSPNMPTLETALVYPGAALIEGTNASEGRGTTKPFELIGAPFINSTELAKKLNALNLPGVTFRSASFTPTFSKHSGKLSHGVQIHITDRDAYQPVETGLHIVKTIQDLYPESFSLTAFFDNLIGNGWIRQGIKEGMTVKEMKSRWEAELKEFKKLRNKYLLY